MHDADVQDPPPRTGARHDARIVTVGAVAYGGLREGR